MFSDQFSTRLEAFHRERQIKGWSRARKEALIKGDWDGLVELSNRSSGEAILRQAQDEGLGAQDDGKGVRSFDRLRMKGKRLRMGVGGAVLRQAQDDR